MTKTTKDKLAARIAENRRFSKVLTPAQDAELLAAYLYKPPAGVKKASYRSLAAEYGHAVGTVRRAIKRASELVAFLLVLGALCVDSVGCAGAVATTRESDPEPFGWCCYGICGLDPWQADTFEQCECSGLVHPVPDTRGECMERSRG